MEPCEALVALNLVEHVGPVRVRQLLEHFGDAPAILHASKAQLLQVRGIGEDTAEAIAHWEKTTDLGAELKRIEEFGCGIVTQADPEYPELLRQIYDPPIVLYVKGELNARDKNSVAMVGSRMTTHYGIETARKLAYQLAFRVVLPGRPVADAHRIGMGVHHDDGLARSDAAQHVAHGVHAHFVEARFLHLLAYALDDGAFVGAFGGDGDQIAEKGNDLSFVRVGGGGNFRGFHETTFPTGVARTIRSPGPEGSPD